MIINYFIPIIGQFFSTGIFQYFFLQMICLAFIGTVPVLIRYLIRR